MRKQFESTALSESKEQHTSKIDLHFLRHGEKDKTAEGQSDNEVELTSEGKRQALSGAGAKNINQAVAFGSSRKRTMQAAGLRMAGEASGITGDESFEELMEKLDNNITVGSKIGREIHLDFPEKQGSKYWKELHGEFKKNNHLKYLVEQSDERARELDDAVTYRYSSSASQVAKIVQKYLRMAARWDALVQDESRNYSDTLERYFGTHLGILESFLAKVIEKMKGIEERDKFVSALGNQGFDYAEGFNIEIKNSSGNTPVIHISYKKEKDKETTFAFDEDINAQLINDIVLST